MADLFEEIGDVEDDNYIFLNEDGRALIKQEIFLIWAEFPAKKFHVYCKPDDTISYIKAFILVSLEKYRIFEGVNQIKVSKLYSSGDILPKKGSLEKYIKVEKNFYFEVETSDIWMEVQVDLGDLHSVLFFEVKIGVKRKLTDLQCFFLEVLNSALKMNNHPLSYEAENIDLKQMILDENEGNECEFREMILKQDTKLKSLMKLDYESCVKGYFNLKNRFLLCTPKRKILQDEYTKRSELRKSYHPVILHILQNNELSHSTRNCRIEKRFRLKKTKTNSPLKEKTDFP